MSHQKRMCCPKCGYNYGYKWIFLKGNVPFSHPFEMGTRCLGCNAGLYLSGKSATFAKYTRRVFSFFLAVIILIIGAVTHFAFKYETFLFALSLTTFLVIIGLAFVFLVPFLFNLLIVAPFLRGVGYISVVDDTKLVVEKKQA